MILWRRLAAIVAEHGVAALVSVHEAKGSTPREAGARMIVRPDGAFHGTIGGGGLEWAMLREARQALAQGRGPARLIEQALGPDLGQCCGGWVRVRVEIFDRRDLSELEVLARREGEGAFAVACRIGDDGRVERALPSPLSGAGSPSLTRGPGEGVRRNSDARGANCSEPERVSHTPLSISPPQGGRGQAAPVPQLRAGLDLTNGTVNPSPLVGKGREGGTRSDRSAREANASSRKEGVPPPLPTPADAGATLSLQGRGKTWREAYGADHSPVLLFGAGHVGRALVLALAPLPFAVRWIDARDDAFPAHVPANATPVRTADLEGEVARASADALVLVMTHDHALDLVVTAAALRRDVPFVGLIGSATKRARFERRFREIGIPDERIRSLVCPIGLPGIASKEPAAIAASVAAQLLAERERLTALSQPRPEGIRNFHDHAFRR